MLIHTCAIKCAIIFVNLLDTNKYIYTIRTFDNLKLIPFKELSGYLCHYVNVCRLKRH